MRAACVHAHVYQPPREDPVTGEVPVELSAVPMHDWNERITAECYRPMAAAHVLRSDGTLDRAINLYAHLSFDVGPTLAVWLDRFAPDVMASMVAGDRASCARSDGHGGAIAHPWVHAILPLASERDRSTLLHWGVADFVHRFGRQPEGMWMPETAADTTTLEALADHGIAFTIVAPHQLTAVDGSSLDPTLPARVSLPSGRTMIVFTYDGALAHGVAFGELLRDGDRLATALAESAGSDGSGGSAVDGDAHLTAGLRSLATDAETFGHHHRFGEMALARAIDRLDGHRLALVSYAEWLHRHGCQQVAVLVEDTSWSCAHGIERWRSDCGCCIDVVTDSSQQWRTPLRLAIDWLVARSVELTETFGRSVLVDPWAARDAYVEVLIGAIGSAAFARVHGRNDHHTDALVWMEAHRHLLMAQSSCAWFFDHADGHEVGIILAQARVAIEHLESLCGVELAAEWQQLLRQLTAAV
jgi:alpha-amylase/alpha-mannosidase (GH57 family)